MRVNTLWKPLKWIVSLGLITVLMSQVNFSEISKNLYHIIWAWVGISLLFEVVGYGLDTLKWSYLLCFQGHSVSFWKLLNFRLVGQFFNNFLPSNVGGDIVRIVDLSKHSGSVIHASSSVIMSRLTGVFALFPLMCVFALFNDGVLPTRLIFIALSVLGIIFIGFVGIFWSRRSGRVLLNLLSRILPPKIMSHIEGFITVIYEYQKFPAVVINSILLSVLYQGCGILSVFTLCHALSIDISIVQLAIIMPIVATVMMIPLSINGLGVQDVSLVYFFNLLGISIHATLLISILFHFIRISGSLLGGIVFLLRRTQPSHMKEVSAKRHDTA